MSDFEHLQFPSGRSVGNCRKDAKRLSRDQEISLNEALDQVARQNGVPLPWARAIETLRLQPALAPTRADVMTAEDIRATMERYPELTHFGMGIYRRDIESLEDMDARFKRERQSLVEAVDECNKALRFLGHATKRKSINFKRTSYGLKHAVEHYMKCLPDVRNYYVANGAFICAAIHAGFDVKRGRTDSPNVSINISEKSPILEWARLMTKTYPSPAETSFLNQVVKDLGVSTEKPHQKW